MGDVIHTLGMHGLTVRPGAEIQPRRKSAIGRFLFMADLGFAVRLSREQVADLAAEVRALQASPSREEG